MTAKVHSTLISLMEVLQLVRQTFREHVTAVLQRVPPHQSMFPLRTWEYDPRQYVGMLVQEINTMQSSSPEVGVPLRSTQLLVDAGMDVPSAQALAYSAFQIVTALISTCCPEADFGGDGEWSYNLVNECDLQISRTHYVDEVPQPSFPTIAEEILAQRAAVSPVVVPGARYRWFEPDQEPTPQMLTSQDIDAMNGGLT